MWPGLFEKLGVHSSGSIVSGHHELPFPVASCETLPFASEPSVAEAYVVVVALSSMTSYPASLGRLQEEIIMVKGSKSCEDFH